ncbi:MAG TPA: NAD(P)-dependent oxidoreductase [Acidimicrobiales bacterium]|nr:NAD(P)-dependent oxidoreductase [Acidimicrobiales bacterium]
MPANPALYPVSLDVTGRPCLVVGGGTIAAGKVAGLLAGGAAVTVVAPDVDEAIDALAAATTATADDAAERAGMGSVTVRRRPYRAGEAADYRLVVTATGIAAVDGAVAADAAAAAVWVNSADDPARCTFHLPSVHRDGPVSVAVSTGGASPALAIWLRRRAADALGPGLGDLAGLLDEARRRLQAAGRPTSSVDWATVLDGSLPQLVRDGQLDEARQLLADAVDPSTARRP